MMNIGILRLEGVIFLKEEISRLEKMKTKVAARPIPRPLYAEVVTARVGHRPIAKTKIRLFLTMPSIRVCFIFLSPLYVFYIQFLFLPEFFLIYFQTRK